jgi:hypothetical protein
MTNLIELAGQLLLNGEQVSFQVEIRMPQKELSGNYLCRVLSPQLFARCMNVHGRSRDQAVRLALTIVNVALTSWVAPEEDVTN